MGWWGPGKATSGLIIAVAAALAGAALGMAQRPTPPGPPFAGSTVSTVSSIEIHVAGWVADPGVVELPQDAIAADAVAAAGGLRPGARADLINLAEPLRDGGQIVVPGPDSEQSGPSGPAGGPISINRATAADLQTLPGVGPVLADRIVAHRDQVGGFDRVEDLLQVPGIGETKLAAIRDLVRVP